MHGEGGRNQSMRGCENDACKEGNATSYDPITADCSTVRTHGHLPAQLGLPNRGNVQWGLGRAYLNGQGGFLNQPLSLHR